MLDLTNLPSDTDYDLVLYNAAGSELAASRNYSTAAERISLTVAALLRARLSVWRPQQPGLSVDRGVGRSGQGG